MTRLFRLVTFSIDVLVASMFNLRTILLLCVLFPSLGYGNANIVIVGDSLSAGFGLERDEVWVELLEERLNTKNLPYSIINASISGETTAGGRQRLPALIKNHSPSIVIIALGGNDGLRGLSLKTISTNLETMIKLCQSNNVDVLLVGIRLPPNYGPHYTRLFSQLYSDIAKQKNVPLVPSLLSGLEDNFDLFQADGIHPKANAQPILLENVWQALQPLLNQEVTLSLK